MTGLLKFPDRSRGFVPDRLAEARIARQMSRAELARLLDITGQAIGNYETGDRSPDMSTLLRISEILHQPVSFFLRERPPIDGGRGTRFFRSIGTRSNKVNQALDIKSRWLWEIVGFIGRYVNQPALKLPPVAPPANSNGRYTLQELEAIATSVRRHWGLGDGPIRNVIALLEVNGIFVTRFELGSEDIDAFSCWYKKRPYIFLGAEKGKCCRSRWDACHELGHMLLHSSIGQEDLEHKAVRDRIESEANMFAGAFLLPRDAMMREFYSTRTSHLLGMKERWKVSMQGIAHRCKDIGIIDENQYILFRKHFSAKKWIKNEPLDDVIPPEQPEWLLKCWKMLASAKKVPESGVEDQIGFSLDMVNELFGHSDLASIPPAMPETLVKLKS